MKDYIWLNITPSVRILRDGSKQHNLRTVEQWTKAFTNHCRVSHRGQQLESCPACRELQQKLSAAMK